MKKLSKIKLQNAVQLESNEMKMIFGGSGNGQMWCYVDGEGIGPFVSCTDAACQKLYGSGAKCR